jgi:hypothetical protein
MQHKPHKVSEKAAENGALWGLFSAPFPPEPSLTRLAALTFF